MRLKPLIEQVNIPFYQQFIDDDDGEVHANEVMETGGADAARPAGATEAVLRPLREEAAQAR